MKFIDTGVVPKQFPPWLSEADLDFFAGELKRTGFRGGLNCNWVTNSIFSGERPIATNVVGGTDR